MECPMMAKELVSPGHFACPGCGETIAFRHVLHALGKQTVVVTSAGCGSVVDGYYPVTASRVPFFHCSFGTAATTAAGVKAALEDAGVINGRPSSPGPGTAAPSTSACNPYPVRPSATKTSSMSATTTRPT